PNQTINEQTPLSVNATATDADLPANTLTFALVSSPAGMTINPASGAISWTPSEAQGPSTNVVSVSVTDNGVPALSVTNTFTVTVNVAATAPVIKVVAVAEGDAQIAWDTSASPTDAVHHTDNLTVT